MPGARCRMWWIPPHPANNLLWRRQTPEFTPAGISLRTKKAKASVTGWARERAAEVPMAAVAVKRVLFVCGALGLIPPLLDCAATTSGTLASPTDKFLQQHQRQVLGVLKKRSDSVRSLRGSAGSSDVTDLHNPKSLHARAATAVVGTGGRPAAGGGMAGARQAQVASLVAAEESEPRYRSAARAARRQETKQGSRRTEDSRDGESGDPEGSSTGKRLIIVFGTISALVFLSFCWCWVSSVLVCVSWCVCKWVRPNSRDSSLSSAHGGKQVDDCYANAVRATFCGTLANVVCVSHGDGAGVADDEAVPASQPCTPRQAGNNGSISMGDIGSRNSNNSNNATSPMKGEATATVNGGTKAAAGGDGVGSGVGSNSSLFSATFRCSLTATAVAPGTPGVTTTAQGNTIRCTSSCPQQEQQLCGSISTSHGISPVNGGEGGGRRVRSWEAEEKRSSEMDSTATVVALPQGSSRPGILRLFGNNGRDSQPADVPATWITRVWARLRSVGRDTGDTNLHGEGAVGTENSTVFPRNLTNSDGFSDRSSEEVTQDAEHHGVVVPFTHRRMLAARVARSRAGGRGHSSNGHASATPPLSVHGNNNNGRGTGDLTVFGCGGSGAWVSPAETRVGSHERCSLTELGATRHTPNSGHGVGDRETARKATDSVTVEDVITESLSAGTSLSIAGDVTTVAGVDPLTISKKERHPGNSRLDHACKEKGGGEKEAGGGDGVPPLENMSKSPALPRARVLWRAFSEVDHEAIGEDHRRARLRYLERFDPAPGTENPPMCYSPFRG